MYRPQIDFSALMGKHLESVSGLEPGSGEVIFNCTDGSKFRLDHNQDCCEHVYVEEVHGDASDLTGLVVEAEEVSNYDAPEPKDADSYTWTFYKIGTAKGHVTIRWLGQSNGYYSESVSFTKIAEEKNVGI